MLAPRTRAPRTLAPTAQNWMEEAGERLCRVPTSPSIYPLGESRGRRPPAFPHFQARRCNTRGGRRPARPWPAGAEEERSYDPWKTIYLKQDVKKKKKNFWKSVQQCDFAPFSASSPEMVLEYPRNLNGSGELGGRASQSRRLRGNVKDSVPRPCLQPPAPACSLIVTSFWDPQLAACFLMFPLAFFSFLSTY